MRKKIITLTLVMVTIINIIAAAFIFFDIQMMQAPETTISIDIIEMSSEEAIVQTTIDIDNPNSFEIITKDFELITTTSSGDEVAHMKIKGDNIPPNKNKIFTETFVIDFNGNSPGLLNTKLTGTVGMKTGFIQKTIPLAINVVTYMEDVIKQIATPVINIEADFGEINQKNINITMLVEVYNPNTFDISIEDILIKMVTETGESVGELIFTGGTLAAKSFMNFSGSGTIYIKALNAEKIIVNMSTKISATIAGFTKALPFYIEAQIKVPDLETLLSPDSPLDIIIWTDYKTSINGLISKMTLEVRNPTKIVFVVKDLIVSVYRVDKEDKKLISECELEEGIVEAENVTFLRGETIIPYLELLPQKGGGIIPEGILVRVRGNATIQGINQSVWVGVSGYQDLNPFR